MKNKIKYLIAVMLVCCLGCAGTGVSTQKGLYIGTSAGEYADVHYRVESGNLLIAFENTSTVNMENLIVAVEQKTAGGSVETQSTSPLLRVRTVRQISLIIPTHATGEVNVNYYFFPAQAAPIAMSPYDSGEEGYREPVSGSVSFHVINDI